jgi:hypothetical protein
LVAVDLVTSWTECLPVWGKGQSRVGAAIEQLRRQLPFPLLGLNSDNGTEFINHALWKYCQSHGITFTRSRSYKKNDQAHVEQKNWSVVRRLVGYDRFDSRAAFDTLPQLYQLVRLHTNFFQPTSKLIGTQRQGAKVHKQYDLAQTPYQRLLAAAALSPAQSEALAAYYSYLNPVKLRSEIEQVQHGLWKLAREDSRYDAEAKLLACLDIPAELETNKTLRRKGNTLN